MEFIIATALCMYGGNRELILHNVMQLMHRYLASPFSVCISNYYTSFHTVRNVHNNNNNNLIAYYKVLGTIAIL